MMHKLGLQDCLAQPWRNGGGVTRELLAWPVQAQWLLRVSVATIDRSGPFSPFPGVERWFTVLTGAGVRLALADGLHTLAPGDEPVQFDGEEAPDCALVDGPTTDLNLMLRRGAGTALMQRATAGSSIEGSTQWRALFTAAPVLLGIDGVAEPVPAGTLVWSDGQEASVWCLRSGGDSAESAAWWLTLQA